MRASVALLLLAAPAHANWLHVDPVSFPEPAALRSFRYDFGRFVAWNPNPDAFAGLPAIPQLHIALLNDLGLPVATEPGFPVASAIGFDPNVGGVCPETGLVILPTGADFNECKLGPSIDVSAFIPTDPPTNEPPIEPPVIPPIQPPHGRAPEPGTLALLLLPVLWLARRFNAQGD